MAMLFPNKKTGHTTNPTRISDEMANLTGEIPGNGPVVDPAMTHTPRSKGTAEAEYTNPGWFAKRDEYQTKNVAYINAKGMGVPAI
jgi:hypothetical protein